VAALDVGEIHPATQTRLRNPELSGDLDDRLLPQSSKLDSTLTELGWMSSRHLDSLRDKPPPASRYVSAIRGDSTRCDHGTGARAALEAKSTSSRESPDHALSARPDRSRGRRVRGCPTDPKATGVPPRTIRRGVRRPGTPIPREDGHQTEEVPPAQTAGGCGTEGTSRRDPTGQSRWSRPRASETNATERDCGEASRSANGCWSTTEGLRQGDSNADGNPRFRPSARAPQTADVALWVPS
jgi:hypothetical protein